MRLLNALTRPRGGKMEFRKLFVVYDPTRTEQPALERAAFIAAEASVSLHVFTCIFSETEGSGSKSDQVRELISQQQQALIDEVAPLVAQGFNVTTEVEWDKNWYKAVVRASIRHCADVVLKSTYSHTVTHRVLKKTSDWTLVRECLCPVLLVKDTLVNDSRTVLAAVDVRTEKDSYKKLNQQIIEFSQRLMDNRGADVHFINAFKEPRLIPDRNTLIQNCGVDSDRIHIQMGDPEEVILYQAEKLGASLVVVGHSARSGVSAAIAGNTVEKVLDKLQCDVLSMP